MLADRSPLTPQIVRLIYPHCGNAYVIGIAGPPGVGKSSLLDKLIFIIRRENLTAGVIAIDATSPFTGGALLGDRLRMQRHTADEGVLIYSLATRGHLGGLAQATQEAIWTLGALGKDIILIETVGIGQIEVEIAQIADTTVLVMMPGAGDQIQTLKAGIIEVSDIFVVNKSDHKEADKTALEIENMLKLNLDEGEWKPPVIKTQALSGEGISELWFAIKEHRSFLLQDERLSKRRRERIKAEIVEILTEQIRSKVLKHASQREELSQLVDKIDRKEMDPYTAASLLLEKLA
jgi:LAO/AO transport system kinase